MALSCLYWFLFAENVASTNVLYLHALGEFFIGQEIGSYII